MNDRFETLLKMVGSDCYHLVTNMNDVFGWACAEGGEIDSDDIESILPVYDKFGFDALIAYEVLRRDDGHPPAHGKDKQPGYLAALEQLTILASDGTILWEKWYRANKLKNTIEK